MAKAIFTLADEDGQVRAGINFGEHFDPKSPAHVAATVLLELMEQLQEREQAEKLEDGLKKINPSSVYARLGTYEAKHSPAYEQVEQPLIVLGD